MTWVRTMLWSVALLGLAGAASANHPVFVEGNCFGTPGVDPSGLQATPAGPGVCGDYDGDGLIGDDEDNDGDNTFGWIGAALAAVGQNGRVLIVTSGTFPEVVTLNPTAGGNVSLEAAPGVDANIDAVVQGNPGSGARQGAPGIVVDGCDTCRVVVRNLMIRNWLDGIRVMGSSHVQLDGVRLEGNLDHGIRASDSARVAISGSQVNGTGFRKGAAGVGLPNPGIGILFEGLATGSIADTSVTGSAAAGLKAPRGSVDLDGVQLFDNNPDEDLGRKPKKPKKPKKP